MRFSLSTATAVLAAAAFLTPLANGQLITEEPSVAPGPTSTQTPIPEPTAAPTPGNGPSPRGFTNFAFTEYQKLFVSDGVRRWAKEEQALYAGLYSLDLSVPWTSDKPAWKNLTYRSTGEGETAGQFGISKDNATLFFFDGKVHKYDVKTNTWAPDTSAPSLGNDSVPFEFADHIVTDPETGILHGFGPLVPLWTIADPEADGYLVSMAAFDPATGNYTYSYNTNSGGPNGTNPNSLVFSAATKKLYAFEWERTQNDSALFEYDTSSKKWTQLNTTGDAPTSRGGVCFAPAYGGTKLILAGGKSVTDTTGAKNAALDDIYVYDVPSSVWRKMANASKPYHGAACAVTGDFFIIWGGYNVYATGNYTANEDGPAIFNISANTWGTNYSPTPAGTPPSKDSSNKPSTASQTWAALIRGEMILLAAVVATLSLL